MGLSRQQGPLTPGAIGRFLVPEPLPERLLCIEPLRRRMRVRFGGAWIAESERVLPLCEPGRYPVAYFRMLISHQKFWNAAITAAPNLCNLCAAQHSYFA